MSPNEYEPTHKVTVRHFDVESVLRTIKNKAHGIANYRKNRKAIYDLCEEVLRECVKGTRGNDVYRVRLSGKVLNCPDSIVQIDYGITEVYIECVNNNEELVGALAAKIKGDADNIARKLIDLVLDISDFERKGQ